MRFAMNPKMFAHEGKTEWQLAAIDRELRETFAAGRLRRRARGAAAYAGRCREPRRAPTRTRTARPRSASPRGPHRHRPRDPSLCRGSTHRQRAAPRIKGGGTDPRGNGGLRRCRKPQGRPPEFLGHYASMLRRSGPGGFLAGAAPT
eukprot:gene7945-7337_t